MVATSDTTFLSYRPTAERESLDTVVSGEPEYLSECSPKDRPWDVHRAQADQIADIYLNAEDSRWFRRLGERVHMCSEVLEFAWMPDGLGVLTLKLRRAQFCRVRHCPVCQWRRSLMWTARFRQSLPRVLAQSPKARFLFLTLTRRNVPIEELGSALTQMSNAWGRFVKRVEFAGVVGWIRAVEVTRGRDGSAHPHYHVLLMVPGDYFRRSTRKYITQEQWTAAWRESLRLEYNPILHIRAVKPKRAARLDGQATPQFIDAVRETLKYAVKPDDMMAESEVGRQPENDHATPGSHGPAVGTLRPATRRWLLELTRQLHKRRFIACGGILRDVLRESDETNDDLLVLGEAQADETGRIHFAWRRPERRYKRKSALVQ